MAGDNSQQIQDWNGAVGAHWVTEQETMDALIRPFGEAALRAAAPQPGERILDVGCGCGDTSLALAKAVGPAGGVLGLDVSAPMLGLARQRASGVANLSFMEADASRASLPGPFDILYSRFGVMFFDDPPAAFAHLNKAMKSGGRLAFACWQGPRENPWASVAAIAARQAAALPAPQSDPNAPGPFAFADRDRVKSILETAGFRNVHAEPFEAPVRIGASARQAAEMASRIGPVSRAFRDTTADQHPAMLAAIEAALAPHAASDGSIALPGRIWVVTARTG
ncbi:MAG: methyltransferase domain-containing protein [Hyphomonadaceae bacterium]